MLVMVVIGEGEVKLVVVLAVEEVLVRVEGVLDTDGVVMIEVIASVVVVAVVEAEFEVATVVDVGSLVVIVAVVVMVDFGSVTVVVVTVVLVVPSVVKEVNDVEVAWGLLGVILTVVVEVVLEVVGVVPIPSTEIVCVCTK